jgi:hypothetical protein
MGVRSFLLLESHKHYEVTFTDFLKRQMYSGTGEYLLSILYPERKNSIRL